MRVVELRVGRKEFGETLSQMREWIDRVKAKPVNFESQSNEGGLVLVRLEFSRDELGFAFRRDWQMAITAATAAA
jgi:hypothetical protein